MRANYGYSGAEDDDSPVHGRALSFEPKDFLHIKEVLANIILLFYKHFNVAFVLFCFSNKTLSDLSSFL